MIDKIDGGSPYDYSKVTNKRQAGIQAYDAAWQNVVSGKEKSDDSGVIVDIATDRRQKKTEKESEQTAAQRTAESQSSGFTWEQIKESVRSMIAFLKETWRTIWEDAPAAQTKPQMADEIASEGQVDNAEQIAAENEAWADKRIEEAEKQVQMQAVLKSRNLDSLAAILSENGKKRLAKNTTLLTTYDRRGRIVDIEEAERERILHGDKNFIKL